MLATLSAEQFLIERTQESLPESIRLLGIDAFGVNLRNSEQRLRLAFPDPPVPEKDLQAVIENRMKKPPSIILESGFNISSQGMA